MTRNQSSQRICADGSRIGSLVCASRSIKFATCSQPVTLWSCASTWMFGTRAVPFFALTARQVQWSRRVIRPIAAFVAASTESKRGGPLVSLDIAPP
jgi:hypothetical protein